MRNKAKGFPHHKDIDGVPRAKAQYASRRADGTINTHPAERMQASSHRENE
ncbi:small, acid-soluble spore protein K [Evansella sp. AB-rgal1]|uniref:small, acid-soluble spore protein K n=1 Tax=Evansella sp. AB-rgal1 TaxID=3242696 RepID=UPI00359D9475